MAMWSLLWLSAAATTVAPVPLIIDTDAGFDVDDVGAVCLGNALQDNGETEIIAVGHTNGYVKGIGAVSALSIALYSRWAWILRSRRRSARIVQGSLGPKPACSWSQRDR